jgi:hypothetical protein
MITAGEIRIGNFVNYGYKIATVNAIREDGGLNVKLENTLLGAEFDCFDPIPLTPEILVALGFELLPWGYVKKSMKDFGVRLNLLSFSYDVSGNNPVRLKYLHQLQNLYFALTGEELILTDK